MPTSGSTASLAWILSDDGGYVPDWGGPRAEEGWMDFEKYTERAKGFVQASDVEPVIGALLTIGSAVW